MNLLKHLTAAGASLAFIGVFTTAQATSTDVILNLEGNPTCSSLGPNDEVLEYRDGSADGGTVEIPTKDGGTQTLTYTVGTITVEDVDYAGVTYWAITNVSEGSEVNPVNYTILKAQGGSGARVFHFGGGGAVIDTFEAARSSRLAAVSFCYGLTVGTGPTEPVSSCEDFTTEGDTLDGTTITCDATGNERLLINMSLNEDNFGFNDAFHACTCNVTEDVAGTPTPTGLPECNPTLGPVEAGSQENAPPETRSCMEYDPDGVAAGGIQDGVNTKVPVLIQGVENPDSYICYTIDGVRTCYGHY